MILRQLIRPVLKDTRVSLFVSSGLLGDGGALHVIQIEVGLDIFDRFFGVHTQRLAVIGYVATEFAVVLVDLLFAAVIYSVLNIG